MSTEKEPKTNAYRLNEDIILLAGMLNDAAYKANRYQDHEYEHLRQDTLEQLEEVREMIGETLNREQGAQ